MTATTSQNSLALDLSVDSAQSTLYPGGKLYFVAVFTNTGSSLQARITSLNFTSDFLGNSHIYWQSPDIPFTIDAGKTLSKSLFFTIPTSATSGTYQGTLKGAVEFFNNGQWTPGNPSTVSKQVSVTLTSSSHTGNPPGGDTTPWLLIIGAAAAIAIGVLMAGLLLYQRKPRTIPGPPPGSQQVTTGSGPLQPPPVFCPSCGTQNSAGLSFCTSCGSRIQE